jgi:DNA-binding NarL/FixJ family response regulator
MVDARVAARRPDREPGMRAQKRELVRLARVEREEAGYAAPPNPYVRLSQLEHPRANTRRATVVAVDPLVVLDVELTAKQRALIEALVKAPSVSAAATELGMSRSNVYASLRRVGRKVGVTDVSELLRLLRAGLLNAPLETAS